MRLVRIGMMSMLKQKNKGQSLLEFALIVPPLFLLIFGTFDLGFSVYASNTVSLSAREGARLGVIRTKTDAQICQRVTDTAIALNVNCTVNPSPTRSQGYPFTVTVTYTYSPITPVIANWVIGSGQITLTGKSTMVAE